MAAAGAADTAGVDAGADSGVETGDGAGGGTNCGFGFLPNRFLKILFAPCSRLLPINLRRLVFGLLIVPYTSKSTKRVRATSSLPKFSMRNSGIWRVILPPIVSRHFREDAAPSGQVDGPLPGQCEVGGLQRHLVHEDFSIPDMIVRPRLVDIKLLQLVAVQHRLPI